MTKTECERQILLKLMEIEKIYRQYDQTTEPHISMCIINKSYNVNNRYWKEDAKHQINAWYRPEEYDYVFSSTEGKLLSEHFDINTGEVIDDAPES